MMLPIPRTGVFRRVEGVEVAASVPHISDIVITAKPDQRLAALPEGASYLGFVFAAGSDGAVVESALRRAHASLRVCIDPAIPVRPSA
jgi:hypothetical protein